MYCIFTAKSVLKKNYKIIQHLANLWGKVHCLKRPVRWGTVLLKDEKLA